MFKFFGGKSEPVQPEVPVLEEDRPKKVVREVFTEVDPAWPPMPIEDLREYLKGDYRNNTVINVGQLLDWGLGDTPGTFYEVLPRYRKSLLMMPDDYIKKQCLFDETSLPIDIPDDLQDQIKILGELVQELNIALDEKRPPKEIYQLMRRFVTEGGLQGSIILKEYED